MRAVTGRQAGLGAGPVKGIPRCVEGDRVSRRDAGKQPNAGLGQPPVATQYFEQTGRQEGEPLLAPFTGVNVQDHASRIDVLYLQMANLA